MGISFSCPFSDSDDLNDGFEAMIVRSISFDGDNVSTTLRSVSFNGRNSEPTILKSLRSGKMLLEGSVSFKMPKMKTMISLNPPSLDKETMMSLKPSTLDKESMILIKDENEVILRSSSFKSREIANPFPATNIEKIPNTPTLDSGSPKHEAALKLQKVYKSFRTRRKLADCAVLVERQWWELLDFAELKRTSISFFDIDRQETAISRWSRARTRVAKVGKGLSKDVKARKLALQHWLEAIDPRHRYGHNLHFYYVKWLNCESRQPFFYWLDIGEGKEVNLVDRCPRSKLQQQCIKYLGPTERNAYEVVVEDGKFFYKQTEKLLDTTEGPKDAKWIFVLSTSKTLYVGQKTKGRFQHSSFLAGGATSAAGRLVVDNGVLKAVWPHSGHYRPTEENFEEFVAFLEEHKVDLSNVKKSPDEEESLSKHNSVVLRSNTSEEDLTQKATYLETEDIMDEDLEQEKTDPMEQDTTSEAESKRSLCLHRKLTNLEIPRRDDLLERPECSNPCAVTSENNLSAESPLGGYETAKILGTEQDYMVPKQNLDHEENEEEIVSKESILRRINSHKGMKSYQLGKQLSCKWTTGAGPRIGCVRDYPSELQFRVLEQVNLSPRSVGANSSPRNSTGLSPKVSTPSILRREKTATTRSDLR
ncbi:IQ domain-containing protein IQM2-like [Telopea speciosissima]|uniref:IQ domain-containing protein IQM2-like n=1 Tax=Telopea speciosissima TaxID=54955 RepID=UPI001CC60270|nr:IQ domain-containing protein IQM2-like [Telopea speciosissima]